MTEPPAFYVAEIIVIGIVATLVTDIWQRLLHAIAGLPPARWGLIGRWVAGFPRGVFVHQSITTAASVRGEAAVGWAFHYAVGIAWAALYVVIMRFGIGSGPTLVSGWPFHSRYSSRPGSLCNLRLASASWPHERRSLAPFAP